MPTQQANSPARGTAGTKKEVVIKTPETGNETGQKGAASPDQGDRPHPLRREATKALSGGISDAIVDIKVTANEKHEAEVSRNGYSQLFQEVGGRAVRSNGATQGSTFGNKSSLWIWRRSQGTCSGRLKPIIDIQLNNLPTSSEFVLSGYTNDGVAIGGQHLWIKRASTPEEKMDAIVDLFITTGKMKDTSDPIWSSPGTGWLRVDGNFTKSTFGGGMDTILWMRPARSRSSDEHTASPVRSAVAMNDEVRYAKLLSCTRLALRHHVKVDDVKRLATLLLDSGGNAATNNMVRSERIKDFTDLFHQSGAKGGLTLSSFSKLMYDAGLRMAKPDLQLTFNLFNTLQNGILKIEEFTEALTLTDYELEVYLERIRLHLLKSCAPADPFIGGGGGGRGQRGGNNYSRGSQAGRRGLNVAALSKANSGVLGSGIVTSPVQVGKNVIKESVALSQIFAMLNVKDDGILSLDEILDLTAKVEVFVTEEEGRRIQQILDQDGTDRVEEQDFITFMMQESNAATHKSYRVREACCALRRWLVRGTNEKVSNTTSITASAAQWGQFKMRYEKLTKKKFPGFLGAQVLLLTMANLGTRLSALEARELTLLVAPEKNGRIHQADLHSYMGRECRTFGELMALFERELLKEIMDVHRKNVRHEQRNGGKDDADLTEKFRKLLSSLRKEIEGVYDKPPESADGAGHEQDGEGGRDAYAAPVARPRRPSGSGGSFEVISVVHLKDGLESFYKKNKFARDVPENQLPNLEEYSAVAVLVNAAVTEGDIYGIRLRAFLENICTYAVSIADEMCMKKKGGMESLEVVAKDLQRQINIEARNYSKTNTLNYEAVFNLIDESGDGSISAKEFLLLLKRFQLVKRLPEHQVPELIKMFTKGKKDEIGLQDFIDFAKTKGGGRLPTVADVDDDFDEQDKGLPSESDFNDPYASDDEDEDDIEDMTSNVPPVVITRDQECDWLLWFLYRESLKIDPLDPESVVTDLQVRCSETEMTLHNPSISVKEMWNMLFELGLQGSMKRDQFVKGVKLCCERGLGSDDDRVDYEALCRYIVRMGRAFNALVQERVKNDEGKYVPMMIELKKFFVSLSDEKPEVGEVIGAPRFEKLFRRMDTNRDGMLTTKEFKNGLRYLRYPDYKAWSLRLIRRLFDACDRNKDGLLSIKEFTNFILEKTDAERMHLALKDDDKSTGAGKPASKLDGWDLSDDEDDDVFRKSRALSDHQLLRKVSDVLMDIVPVDPQYPGNHTDVVRGSVRRFFQRADPEHKGTVSEERFRAFLRRSGLQDNLTAAELRRLTDKLKRHRAHGQVVVDYERLVQQLFVAVESVPRSKAEAVMAKLQDAAINSAAAGRSFISLCSLVDLKLTGFMSKEELLHTCKMMDCPITAKDIDALTEILPTQAIAADQSIDYRILQNIITSFTPRDTKKYDIEPKFNATFNAPGALPTYAAMPGATSHIPPISLPGTSMDPAFTGGLAGAVTTPLGYRLDTRFPDFNDPFNASGRQMHVALGGGGGGASGAAYERVVRLIVERVKVGVEQKSRAWGAPFSLRRQFEVFDRDNSKCVTLRVFQSTLEDLGVSCSPADLQALRALYGRPEDDRLGYDELCSLADSAAGDVGMRTRIGGLGYDDGAVGYLGASRGPPGGGGGTLLGATGGGYGGATEGLRGSFSNTATASYLHPRVLQRYRQLKAEGNHPREFFSAQDFDRSGMLWANRFTNVINRLQLLQTEHQLSKAIEDFSCISNRAMVMYDEFLEALERANDTDNNPRMSMLGTGRGGPYVNGNGYDGLGRTSNDGWSLVNDVGNGTGLRDSYQRLRNSNHGWGAASAHGGDGGSVDFDDGSDYGPQPPLSPPKVTDSAAFHRSALRASSPGRNRYSANNSSGGYGSTSRGSFQVAHTSPAKVGSKMWGSHTPLARKGKALRVSDDKWCCSVCLYVENPANAPTCAVCDCPNYNMRKDYQVKEQCRNCTFLNGQFAEECEMCGEPLSGSQQKKSR